MTSKRNQEQPKLSWSPQITNHNDNLAVFWRMKYLERCTVDCHSFFPTHYWGVYYLPVIGFIPGPKQVSEICYKSRNFWECVVSPELHHHNFPFTIKYIGWIHSVTVFASPFEEFPFLGIIHIGQGEALRIRAAGPDRTNQQPGFQIFRREPPELANTILAL